MKKAAQLSTAIWFGVVSCLSTPLLAHSLEYQSEQFGPKVGWTESESYEHAQASTNPPVPPLPDSIPEAIAPALEGITGLYPEPSADIGIGHLRPQDLSFLEASDGTNSPYSEANWLQAIAIPIYVEPEGRHWGWLINGWLIPNGQDPIAVGRDAAFLMLQTYPTLFSFPVTEIREDGWFQLQYTPAGVAWAHISHLNLGNIELVVERWEDRFLNVEWIEFRRHGLSQSLYPSPSEDEAILGLVGSNSFIEPIAFDGDWMQVRITQPADGCTFLPGATTQEGWMRWRDSDNQSLIWYPPRGC